MAGMRPFAHLTPRSRAFLLLYLGLVAFSILGSLMSALTKLSPGPIAPVASALTLLAGLAALYAEHIPTRALVTTLLIGTSAEVIGLATGYPFGRYVYTTAWQPTVQLGQLGPFPLLLPFAWLLMVGAAEGTVGPRPYRVLIVALLAAAIDLLMEPVMAGPLGYWKWLDKGPLPGGAPLLNFIGWFAVALLATTVSRQSEARPTARYVLAGHLALTVGIGLIHAQLGPLPS
jgi:putative membrane protein